MDGQPRGGGHSGRAERPGTADTLCFRNAFIELRTSWRSRACDTCTPYYRLDGILIGCVEPGSTVWFEHDAGDTRPPPMDDMELSDATNNGNIIW